MPKGWAAWSRVAVPVSLGLAAGVATAYVAAVDPNEPGHYPPCPFLVLTGLYCPGCGGLRAVHALAHGDPLTALGLNPLVVLLIPVVVLLWGRWTLSAWRGAADTGTHTGGGTGAGTDLGVGTWPGEATGPGMTARPGGTARLGGTARPGGAARPGGISGSGPRKSVQPVHGWLLLTLMLAFWLVRNLPFGEFLAP